MIDTINLKDRTLEHMGRKQYRSKGRGTFWASESSAEFTNEWGETEVVGKCHRAVYYRLTGVTPSNPPTASSQVVFLLGHQVEAAVCESWKQMGIWENNSVRWEDKPKNLSGEFDVILIENGQPYGVECKSFYGYYANKQILGHYKGRGRNKCWIPGKPKDEHLMQTAIYCDQTREDLAGFKIFYVSRDKCNMAEHNVIVDEVGDIYVNGIKETRFNIHDIYNRYARMTTYIGESIKPVREYTLYPSDEKVNTMKDRGLISASAYKAHTEGKEKCRDWHCIGQGTLVLTSKGWIPIESVEKGDLVFKRDGYKKVIKTFDRGFKENIIEIKSDLILPYKCTSDHEILISETNNYHNQEEKLLENIKFVKANEIDTSKLQYSITKIDDKESGIGLRDDTLFMLAAFISEGYYHKNEDGNIYKCGFTLDINEAELAERIEEIALDNGATSVSIKVYEDNRAEKTRRSLQVKVYGVEFINWLQIYILGEKASDKRFSDQIMKMNKEDQKKLLEYLLIFDGSIIQMRNSVCENHTTICKAKALQIQQIYLRNKMPASIVIQKETVKDFGYTLCECKEAYHIRFFPEASRYHGKIVDGMLFTRIRKVDWAEKIKVYDLSVEGLPEFTIQGGIVHNCSYCDFKDYCQTDENEGSTVNQPVVEDTVGALSHGSI